MSDNRIDRALAGGRTALIPFLTAGDPDLDATGRLVHGIAAAAAARDVPVVVELGFPYSDPIADGPTIQASYTRALGRGSRVGAILDAVASWRGGDLPDELPLVAMASYSLVHRGGGRSLMGRAADAGLDGFIVPDLPAEEAAQVQADAAELGLRLIQLVAPTTPESRIDRLLAAASGFVYYVSVAGTTGARTALADDLPDRIAALKARTDLPVCVGFGIGTPEQVAQLRGAADGVIVGSAIVRRLGALSPGDDPQPVLDFVATLLDALR